MDPVERTLTYSIVGAPVSVLLGQRLAHGESPREGLQPIPGDTGWQLTQGWLNWWTLHPRDELFVGVRARPEPVRRWLERHALVLGLAAAVLLAIEVMVAAAWLLAGP